MVSRLFCDAEEIGRILYTVVKTAKKQMTFSVFIVHLKETRADLKAKRLNPS